MKLLKWHEMDELSRALILAYSYAIAIALIASSILIILDNTLIAIPLLVISLIIGISLIVFVYLITCYLDLRG